MTSKSGKTVMVVDDDRHTLSFVEECLLQMGQNVYSASSGEEALKIIRDFEVEVDLLLSDVVMPGINGIELARKLVGDYPSIKVIFMSGYMRPALSDQNFTKFENGFLQKPFSGKTLTSRVKKVLAELNRNSP